LGTASSGFVTIDTANSSTLGLSFYSTSSSLLGGVYIIGGTSLKLIGAAATVNLTSGASSFSSISQSGSITTTGAITGGSLVVTTGGISVTLGGLGVTGGANISGGFTADTVTYSTSFKMATSGAGAPGTNAILSTNITLVFGSSGNTVLGGPAGWTTFLDSGGTSRKIPYY
jgi:hypothetical protein